MLHLVYKTKIRFLQHLQAQAANVDQYSGELGLSGDQTKQIKALAAAMSWFAQHAAPVTDYKEAFFAAYNRFFSTKPEPPIGVFVNTLTLTPPDGTVAGAIAISQDLDQLMLAHKPSQNALEAMDLLGDEPSAPDTIQPSIELAPAFSGYEFAAVISDRADSDQYEIFIRRINSAIWKSVKTATGKSVNITLTDPTTPGQPEQIEVRAQLLRKNENYGAPSNPKYVTLNP